MVGLRRHVRVRTDRTSFEIQSTGPLQTGSPKFSTPFDVREFSRVVIYFRPTSIVSAETAVRFFFQWSDDGSVIPFGANDNIQQSDFTLDLFSDGSFRPKPYVVEPRTIDGSLDVVGPRQMAFMLPVAGGHMRVGVESEVATSGAYTLRAQRLVL
jgi:hypothetical protein